MRGHNQKYQTQLERPINGTVETPGPLLCYAQNLQLVTVNSTKYPSVAKYFVCVEAMFEHI